MFCKCGRGSGLHGIIAKASSAHLILKDENAINEFRDNLVEEFEFGFRRTPNSFIELLCSIRGMPSPELRE